MESDDGIMRFDLCVPKEEGERLKEEAHAAGMSVNQYIKDKLFGSSSEPSGWKGKVATDMCEFRIIENKIPDECLRKEFTELGDQIWQHLK